MSGQERSGEAGWGLLPWLGSLEGDCCRFRAGNGKWREPPFKPPSSSEACEELPALVAPLQSPVRFTTVEEDKNPLG